MCRSLILIILSDFDLKMIQLGTKQCIKCKKMIQTSELHKIVIFVIREKFTDHHYEHVECPEKFGI